MELEIFKKNKLYYSARRTLTDIKETIFGHPTLSEVILAAAHSVG